MVAYRVEARDTVITYQQGFSLFSQSYDTLVFSTFSMLDSVKVAMGKPMVRTNGIQYLECDIANSNYQWVDCATNTIIGGATDQKYIPNKQGEYKVITSGCKVDTSACFTTISLSDSVSLLNNDSLFSYAVGVNYQWVNCIGYTPVLGANQAIFEPIDTGMYAVIVQAYGYSDTSDCFPIYRVGILEKQFKTQTRIYPNPNKGEFSVELPKVYQKLHIQIRNIHGQLLSRLEFVNEKKGRPPIKWCSWYLFCYHTK